MRIRSAPVAALAAIALMAGQAQAQIPHNQDRPPNPARSPQEAAKAMTVPPGFSVEVVASEPNLVNPVAMTFDERGRIWVTESLEYPRRPAGPGRDRIKVMEDTDGDGAMDRFTVFAEGLNIPSGIAVGSGGVWVANSPDILFLQDTDGDGKADKREVVVTGFGRDDTHELPNSLTWGPDGYLYGLNGVFNRAVVKQGGKTFDFTCALFRIHPKTRQFELFAEGTSNPWGVAWDSEGSAFVSACVIDHLWHLVETGYYHRQGGPYPPFTSKIESIVDYKHQKAAYCGIHYFDSDAYPAEFREKLYMGNIHGGCINVDGLARNGSTYKGINHPDFLTANDAWFMPVAQKTGPDGSLYVLDWYDRYHCYQDANRDPAGIDRLKGRLYRVRYKDTPRAAKFDLANEVDDLLIRRLSSPNVYYRDLAQRLLRERNDVRTIEKLQRFVLTSSAEHKARMHALWAVIGAGPLDPTFHAALLSSPDPTYRAWGVRAAGNMGRLTPAVLVSIGRMASDPSPDVQLQLAIAARKIVSAEGAITMLLDALSASGNDPLIPHIVWQNLHPLFDTPKDASFAAGRLLQMELRRPENPERNREAALRITPHVVDRLLGSRRPSVRLASPLVSRAMIASDRSPVAREASKKILGEITDRIVSRQLSQRDIETLRDELREPVRMVLDGDPKDPIRLDVMLAAAAWKNEAGLNAARQVFLDADEDRETRVRALEVLIGSGDDSILDSAESFLVEPKRTPVDFRARILAALGRLDSPKVAEVVLRNFAAMEPELRPKAIELLSQRPAWSKALLRAIESRVILKDALNFTQVRRLALSRDVELARSVKAIWGTIREGRNPGREAVIAQMRNVLRNNPGDPKAGAVVFKNLCAQCHKIYGEGQDVGPELTGSGRGSFDQLLSNVLDPSLVIGEAYQATSVVTTDGRVLNGLQVENSPQRIVLKLQGGKVETIPRGNVDEVKVGPLSLMPEELEKQLKPQEIIDLFAFLGLDKPPTDPSARPIPGTPETLVKPGRAGPAPR